MKILALESSAVAASVALTEDDRLIAESFMNTALTHSRTLLPMAESLLAQCGAAVRDIDVIAVAVGPGSFTGIRIGIAAAKGLAWAAEKPCAGISTLEAMAWRLAHIDTEICAVMDARRGEVYNARFAVEGGVLRRITPDRAIPLSELADELKRAGTRQIIVGDGAELCYNYFADTNIKAHLAPPHLLHQSAWGVARAAVELAKQDKLTTAAELRANYLRKSQAEREKVAGTHPGR